MEALHGPVSASSWPFYPNKYFTIHANGIILEGKLYDARVLNATITTLYMAERLAIVITDRVAGQTGLALNLAGRFHGLFCI